MTSEYHLALKKEQLVQLLSNNTKTTLANSFLALLLTYVLWNVVPQNLVTIWITVLISVNFIRFLMGLYFINHPEKEMKQVSTRLNCFRAGACISAIVWGMSNLLVFDHELDKYQFLVAYLLAGISAGAAVAYSTDLISALAFTFLTIVPMVIIFISSGDPEMMAMAAASSAYLVFMPLSIKMFNAKLIEGIHLRWDAEANAKAIEQLAFYDELTSLPNRRLLLERMQAALLNAERNGSRVALMFIDLDRFKTLNDEYGHDMGDLLLQKLAERLKRTVRKSDMVARLAGDEFVIMLENIDDSFAPVEDNVMHVAEKVLHQLQQPYDLTQTLSYSCTPSIGVSISDENNATTVDSLIKDADDAMYAAKRAGRNTIRLNQ